MLAYVNDNNINIWNGEQLPNGLNVQVNVGDLWTESELNNVGLYTVEEFRVPAGQQFFGSPSYTFQNNTIIQTYQIEPIPVKPLPSVSAVIT